MTSLIVSDETQGISLVDLAERLGASVKGQGSIRVSGVQHDSRRVNPGDLFVARQGQRVDALNFVDQAQARGASAVMVDVAHASSVTNLPVLVVDDVCRAMGRAAAIVYGDPTHGLDVIGITGTNGKTTTSYLACAALEGCGSRPALMGTLGVSFESLHIETGHTTPESDDVMRVAARMAQSGATHLIMEVSSHALALGRVEGVRFRVAAYSNLTQDHLDFHGDMQAYANAKESLFFLHEPTRAAIMIDDDFGRSLAQRLGDRAIKISKHVRVPTADICPTATPVHDARGIRCAVRVPGGEIFIKSPLVGEHNLSNLLLAIGIVSCLDLPIDRAVASLTKSVIIPGRLERCDTPGDELLVLVDYAHTPDALERTLATVRPLTQGRLICVFGCGGDRDKDKRRLMGDVAGRLADRVIVTNDNPRSERPQDIIASIVDGLKGTHAQVQVQEDRALALEQAIVHADPFDAVLIAGKGHETYQIVGEQTLHFDDREQARAALALRRRRRVERTGA